MHNNNFVNFINNIIIDIFVSMLFVNVDMLQKILLCMVIFFPPKGV
uniref:Uncharacterized protein n=1 Tax=viral metagenome TaxID=1070528 RepID=A0A6C0DRY5_9ZZZZ